MSGGESIGMTQIALTFWNCSKNWSFGSDGDVRLGLDKPALTTDPTAQWGTRLNVPSRLLR